MHEDLRPFVDTRDMERETHYIARYQTRFPRADLSEECLGSFRTELYSLSISGHCYEWVIKFNLPILASLSLKAQCELNSITESSK